MTKSKVSFYLTVEIVEFLIQYAKEVYVNEEDIVEDIPDMDQVNKDKIASILELSNAQMYGQENYPDLFSKAAYIFYSIIKNHPLHNGNKRTAVIATTVFLSINYTQNDPQYSKGKEYRILSNRIDHLYFYKLALKTEKIEREEGVDYKDALTFLEKEFRNYYSSLDISPR